MRTKEILIEARRLIAEKGWTQGAMGRDFVGNPLTGFELDIGFELNGAVCYCSLGALYAASKNIGIELSHAIDELTKVILYDYETRWIINFNDDKSRTKEEVLAVFDKAIEGCE